MITDILLPVALAVIMFAMGLSLRPADFALVFTRPKAMALGLLAQMVLLPLVAWIVVLVLPMPTDFAIGLLILAACPGGITSNLLTHLAGGATALAVSLTAITSVFGALSVPFVVNLALVHVGGQGGTVDLPVARMTLGVFVVATLPLILAMSLNHRWPEESARVEKLARHVATILFAFIVAGAFASQWRTMMTHAGDVLPPALAINVGAMALAWLVGRLGRLERREKLAVVLETGLQNGALGIFIAATLLGSPAMMVPSIVYALVMNVTALAVIVWARVFCGKEKGGVSPAFSRK
ncbi:bile acid:sodium symporter family protein [Magnetospirillum gryphiswaldense]|uniref:bile acid:sodium symporter family protein n=1 Tax=Magnetospirillum gryphiswaldense TaxID=55518 RepID=UPI000D03F006|nr:bile acid:sodium symporter family protein [Magnetospirillum gryphiswaldense]AVM73327.1 Sodium Bile acid symporter family protein [Magnetospirillum gryphiswaldense MSR-1]AVM77230.1 Sodium Bile acid symporter family protein [Magnetospirillum gryphiswaldense]